MQTPYQATSDASPSPSLEIEKTTSWRRSVIAVVMLVVVGALSFTAGSAQATNLQATATSTNLKTGWSAETQGKIHNKTGKDKCYSSCPHAPSTCEEFDQMTLPGGCAASCKGNAKADTYAQLNCDVQPTASPTSRHGTPWFVGEDYYCASGNCLDCQCQGSGYSGDSCYSNPKVFKDVTIRGQGQGSVCCSGSPNVNCAVQCPTGTSTPAGTGQWQLTDCKATVTATSYTSPGTQTWCRGDNWNHTGFYTVTPAECEAKCTADAECNAYEVNPDIDECVTYHTAIVEVQHNVGENAQCFIKN